MKISDKHKKILKRFSGLNPNCVRGSLNSLYKLHFKLSNNLPVTSTNTSTFLNIRNRYASYSMYAEVIVEIDKVLPEIQTLINNRT